MRSWLDDTVTPDFAALWNLGLLAQQGDTGVEMGGEFLVDRFFIRAKAHDTFPATLTLLVKDGQVYLAILTDLHIMEEDGVAYHCSLGYLYPWP